MYNLPFLSWILLIIPKIKSSLKSVETYRLFSKSKFSISCTSGVHTSKDSQDLGCKNKVIMSHNSFTYTGEHCQWIHIRTSNAN